jgi:tetratricopeptide (TPR) repeat protein
MNFIFKSYPAHPWFSDWIFEPRNCSSSFRENSIGRFFQTLEPAGKLAPNIDNPEWTIQILIPKKCSINLLFNGFCAYSEHKKKQSGAEVLTPEAGILWGRTEGVTAPELTSELQLKKDGIFQWLETDSGIVLLAHQNDIFCLVTKFKLLEDAKNTAQKYFKQDLEEQLSEELKQRSGAQNLFEEMAHHDALAAICAESMMKAYRPPEGAIPLCWCQSSTSSTPMMDVNEIHTLAPAWSWMDPEIAEELILCTLKIQTNAGAIPVHFSPHATFSVMEAPKPMLAKTLETVWEVRKNRDFLSAALPLIRRHIQWLLHHFDPKRRGIHCWNNRAESIIPEQYQSDLSTVDLSVLLITEIDAYTRLQTELATDTAELISFDKERSSLEQNILTQFWNNQENRFINALQKDQVLTMRGFSSFMPLLWKGLPHNQKTHILESIYESGKLPGGLSVLSWRKSAMDDDSFPLIQQLLVFQSLKTAEPHGQLLNDFSRVTLQGFVEWHTLALAKEKRLPINPVTAAYIMNLQALRQYRYHAKGVMSGYFFKLLRRAKADRFDLAVVAATLFAVFSVHLIYSALHAPPPFDMLEAQMNSAYANRNINDTLKNCMAIMKYYPDDSDVAMLLAANISMLRGDSFTASDLYEKVRERYPDSPGPMIALGLAYQLQGKFQEAEKNYAEFCYIFEDIFPELVSEVNHFRYLIEEQFKTPPKWQEIYRYQLMHEL